MKLFFFIALLILAVIFAIYVSYKKNGDKKELLKKIGFVVIVMFFTYISKTIIVHKPIFVLHLSLVMLSWIGLFIYLIRDKLNLWMIFAPTVSTVAFFLIALFFREHG